MKWSAKIECSKIWCGTNSWFMVMITNSGASTMNTFYGMFNISSISSYSLRPSSYGFKNKNKSSCGRWSSGDVNYTSSTIKLEINVLTTVFPYILVKLWGLWVLTTSLTGTIDDLWDTQTLQRSSFITIHTHMKWSESTTSTLMIIKFRSTQSNTSHMYHSFYIINIMGNTPHKFLIFLISN